MIEEQIGDTPSPDASPSPPPPSARRLSPYLLYAAGAVAVIALGIGLWFASGFFFKHEIAVVFLNSDGKEITRRNAQSDGRAQDGVNYYLDWAFQEAERLTRAKSGNMFVAVTTFDAPMQSSAEKIIAETMMQDSVRFKVNQVALVAMTPDGAVRAMVGGRSYKDGSLNRITQVRRQPGSSFTPYVFLLALQGGAAPSDTVTDTTPPCENRTAKDYSGGRRRPVTLTKALAHSVNSTPVQLSLDEHYGGREKFLALLRKLGFEGIELSCTMALGDQGITPLSHVAAYAHFANGGTAVRPYAILELRDPKGKVVYSRSHDEPEPPQIIDRAVVEKLNSMLRQVITVGTGKTAALDFTPVAGKTGTSADYKDAWFVGFTGSLVTGVWMGNDNSSPADKLTGGTLPAQIWKDFNIAVQKDQKIPPIPGVGAETTAPPVEAPATGH